MTALATKALEDAIRLGLAIPPEQPLGDAATRVESELVARGYVIRSTAGRTPAEEEASAVRFVPIVTGGFGLFVLAAGVLLIVAGALGLHWG